MTDTQKFPSPAALLTAALVLASFTVSLFFEGYRDIHYAPAILCILAASALCVLPALVAGRLDLPRAPAASALFALWLYITISLSWSTVPYASLVTYLVFTAAPLAFFAPLLSPARAGMLKALAAGLMAALAVLAAWAVIQYAALPGIYGPRAHHPLPSPNNLAGLLNLGLLPALALFLCQQDKRREAAACALFLLLFAGLVATQSRGGLIGALAACAVMTAVLRPPARKILIPAASAAALFLALGALGHMDFATRLAALAAPLRDEPSLARLAIWEGTWRMVRDHMWLGTGFGTFYLYYPSYRLPGPDNSTGNWAHMDPLQYWAEMGIAAPVLFYLLCLAVLLRTVAAVRALPPGAPERAAIMGPTCGLAAMVLQSHADFNLYVMPVLIVSGAWLACWYDRTSRALPAAPAYASIALAGGRKLLMAASCIALVGLLSLMAASSALGQYHLNRARLLIAGGLPEQFTAAIAEAEKWAPRSFIDPEIQLAALYIDLLAPGAAALFTQEEKQSLFIQARDLLDAAQSANPAFAEIDYKRGQLYTEADPALEPDAGDIAAASLETALRKNPMHARARQALAELYIARGRVDRADELLERGLQYPHSEEAGQSFATLRARIAPLVDISRAYSPTTGKEPPP